MTDLFGLEQQTPRTNNRLEAAALLEVMKALHTHPLVSWCERMNSGAVQPGVGMAIGAMWDSRYGPLRNPHLYRGRK